MSNRLIQRLYQAVIIISSSYNTRVRQCHVGIIRSRIRDKSCLGATHNVCHAIFGPLSPPAPMTQTVTNLGPPPPKVRDNFKLKINN